MAKDAFDRWWEWVEKPADSPLTIPAYLHDAEMRLSARRAVQPVRRTRRCGSPTLTRTDDDGPMICTGMYAWTIIVDLRNRLQRRYGV